jgi:hypothetical protein
MGASAQRPTSSTPGSGGSGFYQNALNQQKQAVANVPVTQAAQGAPGTPPNRPGGFGGLGDRDPRQDQAQAAYNQYMQAHQKTQGPTGGPTQRPPSIDYRNSPDYQRLPANDRATIDRQQEAEKRSQQPVDMDALRRQYQQDEMRNRQGANQGVNTATLDAYYKQKYGDRLNKNTPAELAEQDEMRRRQPAERPPTSPKGITMGAGYSNRPFG